MDESTAVAETDQTDLEETDTIVGPRRLAGIAGELDDATLLARIFHTMARVSEALPEESVPPALGHVERIRVALWARMPNAPGDVATPADDPPADRLIRVDEVIELTGLARTTIWRRERAGTFPRRRQLGANSVAWSEREVLEWIDSRPEVEDAEEPEEVAP